MNYEQAIAALNDNNFEKVAGVDTEVTLLTSEDGEKTILVVKTQYGTTVTDLTGRLDPMREQSEAAVAATVRRACGG